MNVLFPWAKDVQWKRVNLTEEFLKYNQEHKDDKPLDMKSVNDQKELLFSLSENLKVRTFGGYGENRTLLWDGFEPSMKRMLHLGMDFNNLVCGELVGSISDGIVCHTMYDRSKFNGWGLRIMIFEPTRDLYFLYGHLGGYCSLEKNQKIKRGDIIGQIGFPDRNGGWFPHLHLQVMTGKYVSRFKTLEEIDGYAEAFRVDEVLDPEPFILSERINLSSK